MDELLSKLRNKNIHVVGITGAEGSSILRFLIKQGITKITGHDFVSESNLEKSFKLWHKGLDGKEREKLYQQFYQDISAIRLKTGPDYLKTIQEADLIFVPQSWRLYKEQNSPLFKISGKIPFYSLTRLYLDFTPAKIITVTGTVGKGSTANIIFQLLKKSLTDRKVYFAGNETWMPQLADKLDEMKEDDILILEISHRQLQEGFTKTPHVVVITNIYPNHMDEVSWETYMNLKLSLVRKQQEYDTAILNYDVTDLRLKDKIKSKVIYFSKRNPKMNIKSVQKYFKQILSNRSDHYTINILAGLTAIESLGIDIEQLIPLISQIQSLPARLELIKTINGINFYNDIKSTTPWATLAALDKLGKNTILICGGRSKGIDYREFVGKIKNSAKFVVILKSELEDQVAKLSPDAVYSEVDDFKTALNIAYQKAGNNDNILVSPAAGFFYTDFIKGKKSLRQLVISLPPKGQIEWESN